MLLSTKDLVFKERPSRKLTERYVGPYVIEEVVSSNVVNVKIIDNGLYFIFPFHFILFSLFSFLFLFLFLEQLRLGFISHAVTSVTN